MQEEIANYHDDYVPILHNILTNSDQDRKIKLNALTALGDLSILSGHEFNKKYLIKTLEIFGTAAEQSFSIEIPKDDLDLEIFI